jgi:hypothetical protein
MRDFYTGDPVAQINPQFRTDWVSVPFRVWGNIKAALTGEELFHSLIEPVGMETSAIAT